MGIFVNLMKLNVIVLFNHALLRKNFLQKINHLTVFFSDFINDIRHLNKRTVITFYLSNVLFLRLCCNSDEALFNSTYLVIESGYC